VKRPPEQPAALEKRAQPARLRANILAVIVHAVFFSLIVFGVTWQSSPTAPVVAELWKDIPNPQKAAPPKPEPPKPEPEPEPPKPEPPKPEPPKPEPPKPEPEKVEPPKPDPAIALQAEREKQEREKKQREKEKKERERLETQKQEEARKKKEQEEVARKKREDEKRRAEEERLRKEAERAQAEAASARQKAIDGWVARIRDKIRQRANVPDTVSGKPSVQVNIRILPGGEVLDIKIVHPSGNRVYDTAIERAIRSASPLPVPPADSELFPTFRDLNLNIEHER
jgi:colicin import membrane protein